MKTNEQVENEVNVKFRALLAEYNAAASIDVYKDDYRLFIEIYPKLGVNGELLHGHQIIMIDKYIEYGIKSEFPGIDVDC